jgi:outer membrane biogenesis lipoprotein LolB
MRYASYAWLLAIAILVSGCSTLGQTPTKVAILPESPEVTRILLNLSQFNAELLTFKGTGKLKLWKKDGTQVVRSAWTGARPDKIRVVIQGITGFPVASMAADGNRFYLLSYSQDSFYQAEIQDPNLDKIVSIPVTAGDLIKLISGVVPIRKYQSSTLIPASSQSGYILSLMGEKDIAIEKIYLDQAERVQRIEMFTLKGKLAYRVDFEGETEVDGFRVPARLVFNNEDGSGFQLDLDQFWPNAPVSSDMFVITPQG